MLYTLLSAAGRQVPMNQTDTVHVHMDHTCWLEALKANTSTFPSILNDTISYKLIPVHPRKMLQFDWVILVGLYAKETVLGECCKHSGITFCHLLLWMGSQHKKRLDGLGERFLMIHRETDGQYETNNRAGGENRATSCGWSPKSPTTGHPNGSNSVMCTAYFLLPGNVEGRYWIWAGSCLMTAPRPVGIETSLLHRIVHARLF